METNQIKQVVANFIEDVWNQKQFDRLDHYLHPEYVDHSLPPTLSPDRKGLVKWIQATSRSFSHQTIIEDQVTEADKTILRVKMDMTHIGTWRDIEATEAQVTTTGFRFYRLAEGKIIEHWATMNATVLESQLRRHSANEGKAPA